MLQQLNALLDAFSDDFMPLEFWHGECVIVPNYGDGDTPIPADEYDPHLHGADLDRELGYWYRFSAAGYLDRTDWHGPFDSQQEMADDILANYVDFA